MQGNLFPVSTLPEGFVYQPDFLTEGDEAKILSSIRQLNFEAFDFHGYKAKRRIVAYGWEYDFGSGKARLGKPLSDFLLPLKYRAAEFIAVTPDAIVEAVVTEYPQGAPIGWHRDVPQFETIVGISLLGFSRMRLKPFESEGKLTSIILEPRSIYALRGAARWNFQHSIAPVKNLRYSITFRTVREDVLAIRAS